MIDDPAALVDGEILLRGVAATRFNTRGEATGSRVIASVAGDLVVMKPPPSPDAVPRVTLDYLLPFRPEPIGPHRVRVEGTVTFSLAGKFFYLQDGDCVVRVETSSEVVLNPGDQVEAAGFIAMSRSIGTLADATVRRTGAASIPRPVAISPEEILSINQVSMKTGQVARPHDYDGHLVRCRARLLAVQSDPYGGAVSTLTLERNNSLGPGTLIFRARLHEVGATELAALRPGSELEVTGLVQLEYQATESPLQTSRTIPLNLDLILRGPADVRVIRAPSWWTATHFTAVLAAVVLALGGALVWNLQLKRQVRKKSRLLTREKNARRDAALEFRTTMRERNRLAANLHDTLPQTMSAIGLQLDACEFNLRRQGIASLPPLEMVRTMVEFAVKELRGAVWEMRSFSLRGRSFSEALREVVERVGIGHSATINVRTDGPLEGIPEFVSGNLLLIVQEALRNARQHGNPRNISVEISTSAPGAPIRLVISDDGSGFTPGSQNGPEQGHYGIVGMRERAERLGGSLRVDSSPGQGTRIMAEVSQHADDDDLANEKILPDSPISKAVGG
jgi:signal transduction histidine kinase